ncbi:MAG: PIG-L family deacetylase [Saprospiraceae bacterium]|nr:PIG-L family deacetylase [Saprospiraceae bacterium]
MTRFSLSCLAAFCLLLSAHAQQPHKPDAAELHQMIKKLNVLGSVLYVAAHPDDENQRFISFCANHKLYDVTYLSLTRGDGGQNLVGPELREQLGVLRTQELLMARSVDGGKQRFTRANDFGYSKSAEETLRIWDKDAVLADVVWAFRQTQPDVVVNRFFQEEQFRTHGHHTASAMLSVQAFDLAGRSDVFPEQLAYTTPWQPRRIFFNTSWFFYGSREKFEQVDKTNLFPIDGGVYLPLKGKSNSEVAAEARSMHRCQGFGSLSTRGSSPEWLDFIKGDMPADKDPFAGINTTWTRVEGGAPIGNLLAQIERQFRPDDPAAAVPDLLRALQMIKTLPESYWKKRKLEDIKEVIRHCMGLYLESSVDVAQATPGSRINLRLEAVNRSAVPLVLTALDVSGGLYDTLPGSSLAADKPFVLQQTIDLPANVGYSSPYWLRESYTDGMYTEPDQALRGLPEAPRALQVRWSFTVDGIPLEYMSTVAHKIEEPAKGEVWRPFDVLPPVFVACTETSYLFNAEKKTVSVRVTAGRDSLSGTVRLKTTGDGWSTTTLGQTFFFARSGESRVFDFTVQAGQGAAQVEPVAVVDGREHHLQLFTIEYEHIPRQRVLLPARTPVVRAEVKTLARNVGYFMGAGDEVPAALRRIGCTVTLLEDADMTPENLLRFDAVVLGIRAYNTREALIRHHPRLLQYVEQGGTLVVQYNNNFDLFVENLAPYPMKLSRTRVTEEQAEVRLLLPDHPALSRPNAISKADFDGWVQERGLYFVGEWDGAFAAPLSMNDTGEKPADGSLLIAPYGKGHYVYTSLSFFRELPAGVPGAFRLFANLISVGKTE